MQFCKEESIAVEMHKASHRKLVATPYVPVIRHEVAIASPFLILSPSLRCYFWPGKLEISATTSHVAYLDTRLSLSSCNK